MYIYTYALKFRFVIGSMSREKGSSWLDVRSRMML